MLRLDFNLVLTMINLVVLYLILRKFLFRPLMNIMEQRRTMIADGLQHAEDTKKEAYALKSQYESALGGAKEESTRIIGQAKKDAKAEYDRILDEADQAAGKLMKDARETIDLEKEKTLRDMQIFPEERKNFLKVVVDNGKVDIVMEIFGAYEELEKKRAKIATAKLRYVTLPSEEQKKKMETFICKTFAADGVSWEMKEDPELLGGFILLVDGKEYDYSMAGRLNRLEQTLMRR